MGFWTETDLSRPTGTWIAHSLIGVLVTAIGLAAGHWLPGDALLWGMTFAVIQALYFGLMREPKDREIHVLKGDFRSPAQPLPVTPEIDLYGDQLGNWAIAAATVLYYLHSLYWGFTIFFAVGIAVLLSLMVLRQFFNLGGDDA